MRRWTAAAPAGGIIDTTAVTLKAADPGNWVNEIERVDMINVAAAVNTEVVILSGATVLWRTNLQAAMKTPFTVDFSPPLRALANTDALRVQCLTTASQTYVNAQGTVVA